ncbi:MAG: type IV-A pilus assembly ATPase PilB [Gammaproteobacteria bacterium]|nr:type IV-A pilus assembly ATPase PilB [Gammaproteobacteria bacterium]MCP4832347.1 type IV-A pilus assembly ATPase PilB [Gammaproteobacteria bacterium]MCP4929139.1 type IV-A pilus assembly ATPase PilB [Gammaproteobacteria bacterium]
MTATAHNIAISGLPRRLVHDGIVKEETMLEALVECKSKKATIVEYLVNQELADPQSVAVAASHEFGVPLFNLDALEMDLEVIRKVDQKLISKHRVLPLMLRGKRLFLAVSDPTNLQAIDEIKFQSGFSIDPVVVEQGKLQEYITHALEAVDTSMSGIGEDDFDLESLEISGGDEEIDELDSETIDDAPVVRFVNKVLLDAIKKGCSDVHFEPYEKTYRVRTRLDGILKNVATPPIVLAPKVCARLKVMARLDIAERRLPQDGRIKMKLSKTRAIDFRVNTCPTLYGEKIVLRILDPSTSKLGIDALGYEPEQKRLYMEALECPHGMILVTGPTGSGKTVSLYTGLNILNTETRNISTAEDPAEINLPGVNQVNVNNKVGLTFASALKAFLRQDPDIIMVGEIRDIETAEIGIKAAQTGHLVLSTLHTNDAPTTLTRLVDMGVKPYAIATSVRLIIAQRLARKLCDNCKEILDIPAEALLAEGYNQQEIDDGLSIYGAVGCKSCESGYKGRAGIFQVMKVSEATSRIIMAGGNATDIAEQAAKEGVWDLRKSALEKVKAGITSLDEANRVTVE